MAMPLYFFWSSISMAIFYLFYLLFLRRESFFLLNRIYLFAALCLSIVIPWFDLSSIMAMPKMELVLSALPITGNSKLKVVTDMNFDWLTNIYWAGVLVTSAWLLIKLFKVKRQIAFPAKRSAFSFWRTKVIDPVFSDLKAMDVHEEVHITQLHTLDTLLVEVIAIFFWFNPLIYCYRRSLKLIHEYQADELAAGYAESKKQYAMMLFLHNFKSGPALANTFHSPLLLEARIAMLQRKRSGTFHLLKYVLCIPLIVLSVMICSFRPGYFDRNATGNMDQTATFPGGFKAFSDYLIKNTKKISTEHGRVVVSFVIDIDGIVTNEKVETSVNGSCDKEALRMIRESPKWKPALQKGKAVRSAYQIGINFKHDNQ